MAANKVNVEELRRMMAVKGIFTITKLATLVPCRRETIYFALEQPKKYPRAFSRIMEVVK